MRHVLIVGLTVLTLSAMTFRSATADISSTDKDRIDKGLAVGAAIGDALQDDNFKEVINNIGKKMAPFLGALGPLLGLILTFVSSGPTLEEKLMKKFAKIDRQFDRVDVQFDQVKQLIKWEDMKVKFADDEKSIRYLDSMYKSVISAPINQKAGYKRDFITQYESDYQGAGFKLYDAAVSNDATTYKNVFRAIMQFSGNNRKQVESFMLGYFGLIMKAVIIQLAYYKWAGYSSILDSRTQTWVDRMETLKQQMVKIDNELINGYRTQLSKDLDEFLKMNSNLDNKAYAKKLYAELAPKYYWRYWVVVVTNAIKGADKNWYGHGCGSSSKFRQSEKTVVAASVGKTYSRFDAAKAKSEIAALGKLMANKNYLPNAKYLFTQVPAAMKKYCRPFAFIAFVCQSCKKPKSDFAVQGAPGHTVSEMVKWKTHARGQWGQDYFNREMNAVFFG